jgi:hypothetical protein
MIDLPVTHSLEGDKLVHTDSVWDVTAIIEAARHDLDIRKKSAIPI